MRPVADHSTRERILEVAEAFLGEYGYNGARLHQIAHQVGIQKASLFHYFPSKEHLYRAVLEEGFGETEQTVRRVLAAEGTPQQKIRALVEAYVDMVAAHPQRTKILLRQSLGDAPAAYRPPDFQRLLRLLTTFIADAQKDYRVMPIEPLALVLGVVGMVAFFFTSAPVLAPTWLGDPLSQFSIERVKAHVVSIVERCFTTNDPPCITAPHQASA